MDIQKQPYGQTDTDLWTDRQVDTDLRMTGTDLLTDKHGPIDRHINLWTDRHTDTYLWTNRNRPMGRQTQINGQTDTDLWTDRHTHTQKPMDRQTDTDL